MKICLACLNSFAGDDYICPVCGNSPETLYGYLSFAPELSTCNEGFNTECFASLAELEIGNFWFESRNQLLIWALDRYFSNTDTFFEIGCGTGYVLSGIQRTFLGKRLFGSDIYSQGLIYAEQRLPNVAFYQMDARKIPFESEFDVIGAFDVIEHIEEDEIVLSQMHKALKSKGGVMLTVPQHQGLWSNSDIIACHKRRYSKKSLKKKVEKAGFRILRLTSFISFLLPLMTLSRLRFKWQLGTMMQQDSGCELRQPRLINWLLTKICSLERRLIINGAEFPAGGSLLCVALKDG